MSQAAVLLALAAMSDMLLTHEEALFAAACLGRGADARAACSSLAARGPALVDQATEPGRRAKAFGPLLLEAFERESIDATPQVVTTLRAWRLLETRRATRYRDVLREALGALAAASIDPILLKGVALADTAYSEPVLRHCHDIDFIVPEEQLAEAARVVEAVGFRRVPGATRERIALVHASRLPLSLHTTFCRVPYYRVPLAEIFPVVETRNVADRPVRVLPPALALVQVCVQGLAAPSGPAAMRWVFDACELMDGRTAVDWASVVDVAERHGLELPLAAAFSGLHASLGVKPPGDIIDALAAAASHDALGDVFRLAPLMHAAPRTGADLRRSKGPWFGRALIAAAMIAPAPDYLRWAFGSATSLPAMYLNRVVAAARRQRSGVAEDR